MKKILIDYLSPLNIQDIFKLIENVTIFANENDYTMSCSYLTNGEYVTFHFSKYVYEYQESFTINLFEI